MGFDLIYFVSFHGSWDLGIGEDEITVSSDGDDECG